MRKEIMIGITIGDPNGVGPEVALKALISSELRPHTIPLLIGHQQVLSFYQRALGLELEFNRVHSRGDIQRQRGVVNVWEPESAGELPDPQPGKLSAETASMAYSYIKSAVSLLHERMIDCITTGPISKKGLTMAEIPYSGHTTMLADMTKTDNYGMLLVGGGMRVALVTIHIPLREVGAKITKENVLRVVLLTQEFMKYFDIVSPRLGVCALNPHAGEQGIIGKEEIEEIIPAIKEAEQAGARVWGPLPGDTIFYRMLQGDFDVVIAMYHDQGLIPLKTLAFEKGVNVTMGLPFVRTSVDHGTAFDIAGWGIAREQSMVEAIKLAATLSQNRILREAAHE